MMKRFKWIFFLWKEIFFHFIQSNNPRQLYFLIHICPMPEILIFLHPSAVLTVGVIRLNHTQENWRRRAAIRKGNIVACAVKSAEFGLCAIRHVTAERIVQGYLRISAKENVLFHNALSSVNRHFPHTLPRWWGSLAWWSLTRWLRAIDCGSDPPSSRTWLITIWMNFFIYWMRLNFFGGNVNETWIDCLILGKITHRDTRDFVSCSNAAACFPTTRVFFSPKFSEAASWAAVFWLLELAGLMSLAKVVASPSTTKNENFIRYRIKWSTDKTRLLFISHSGFLSMGNLLRCGTSRVMTGIKPQENSPHSVCLSGKECILRQTGQ